ncbi:hypothetical protein GOP47_0008305 [Adiantum capillus-veneris]|uniref:Uncharacterized protein n=1 Tax=Adiantum capillus-veneris TaxID=13818 RepID=A0A9D4ZKJ6_ADICA|nr:hypothetical protein GOP47_0008305 [Adiantum capillus-veneris]
MSSIKKEIRARNKQGPKSSSTQAGDKVGPESSLVRWLRSQTPQQKASPPDAKSSSTSDAQKQRKHQKPKNASVKDDATKIKMRVKYFMTIIMREQSLIDAYSADGWKGQSVEKIRPEQELKRAEAQILQSKVKIRQELEKLHTLSLVGSIQESAFDDDGQIYFDDIFCAICKSKEVYPENDIILCDGACNRAFHQFCLDPPLRTEDIPPGDDGWLCPVCDSKFECLDAINDNFGTDFKVEDSWEKVFAEVEDASAGDNLLGFQVEWPSEDSEDDDYNPDKAKPAEPGESGKEIGSDRDSSSNSVSDSDSDTSDSGSEVEFFDEFAGTSKARKGPLFEDDEDGTASEMVEEQIETDDTVLVTGKRQRPDVDYKQLYDEVYGANASDYDSSEDEDFGKIKQSKGSTGSTERPAPEKRKKVQAGQDLGGSSVSQGRKSSSKLSKEAVVKLQESFQGCELPSKACKQTLSSELGVSFEDVNAWFRNARRAASRKKKLGGDIKASDPHSEEGGQETGKQDPENTEAATDM